VTNLHVTTTTRDTIHIIPSDVNAKEELFITAVTTEESSTKEMAGNKTPTGGWHVIPIQK